MINESVGREGVNRNSKIGESRPGFTDLDRLAVRRGYQPGNWRKIRTNLSLDVLGQEIQGSLPGEFRRLRVMALTGFVAEPMLGLIAIKLVIHLPLL